MRSSLTNMMVETTIRIPNPVIALVVSPRRQLTAFRSPSGTCRGRTMLAAFIMTGCSACHRLTDELSQMLSLNPATPVRRWRSASGPAMLGIGIETARDPNRDRDVPQPKP